jgi:hypothetical protein
MLLRHPRHIKTVRDIMDQKSIDYLLARGWVKIGEAAVVSDEVFGPEAEAEPAQAKVRKAKR